MGLALMSMGCATTTIHFQGPTQSVLVVDNKPYHLPAKVELSRPGSPGGVTRHDVSLTFTSSQSQEIRAKGHIDMFGYEESDMDKAAVNTCNLDEEQLIKIVNGTVVIFKGQSASSQALYEMTLSIK
jgi:hypothetical protein